MKASEITCSIVLVGTELTEGRIHDTNGSFLASELKRMSFPVREFVVLSDTSSDIVRTLERLLETSSLVLVSGGLGPTSDDITRDAVAQAAGVPLEQRKECIQHLRDRGIASLLKANARQTFIPAGFSVLPNDNGTACGFWGTHGSLIVCLPGPPGELQPLFIHRVVPLLKEKFCLESPPELCCCVFLVPESVLEDELVAAEVPGVSWSTRVEGYRIVVTLRADSTGALERVYVHLLKAFGHCRVAPGETEASRLLAEALRKAGKTIVCAESCTGGTVARLLTEDSGSSDIFWGSFVTYRDNAKERVLGISEDLIGKHGAVSEAVAAGMCEGALEHSGADMAVSITGYAGPAGIGDTEPVGTVWIAALLRGGGAQTICFSFRGGRGRVRRQAAVAALLVGRAVCEKAERLDSSENWGYSNTVFPLGTHVR